MSYLRFNKFSCGRHPKKPNAGKEELDDDEEIPLQTQIENLRAKIALKERYNKALLEEVTESHKGAHQMIDDLQTENDFLHHEKIEACGSGNLSVNKALRNNREFLLALKGRSPEQALEFLDDQIGDQRRKLDGCVYSVTLIRKRLSEAEVLVEELEKWPFPGSTPWEQEFVKEFTKLGVAIARMKVLKDCAFILNAKYKEIVTELKGERDIWPYVVLKLEKSYLELRDELASLQNMLNDAIRLKKTTYYRLVMTEKEYSENRKIRHKRLARIRKMCEMEMQRNRKKFTKTVAKIISDSLDKEPSRVLSVVQKAMKINTGTAKTLQKKRLQVAEFEDKARIVVEAMRVRDLRFCPKRIQTVFHIREVLKEEMERKLAINIMLAKHRGNLFLIKSHLYYTGSSKLEEFERQFKEKETKFKEIEVQVKKEEAKIEKVGVQAAILHESIIGLLEELNEGKKKEIYLPDKLTTLGKMVVDRMKSLVDSVEKLRSLFDPNVEPKKNYAHYVKMPLAKGSCRLGAMFTLKSDEESDDDDPQASAMGFGSEKVLGREELKSRSEKFYAQGKLRKGYRHIS